MTWLFRRVIIACAMVGGLSATTPTVAQHGRACRQVVIESGGRRERETVCRDGGNQAGQAQAPAQSLPPDFRGRIVYRGNYSGTLTVAGPPPRRLNLREVMNSASRREDIAGDIELSLEFDGSSVRGTFQPTGRLGRSRLSGSRRGDECRLHDPDGWPWIGRCDRSGFDGSANSLEGQNPAVRIGFETRTVSLIDVVAQERERTQAGADAEVARRQRTEGAARQPQASARAPTRSAPTASPIRRPNEVDKIARCSAGYAAINAQIEGGLSNDVTRLFDEQKHRSYRDAFLNISRAGGPDAARLISRTENYLQQMEAIQGEIQSGRPLEADRALQNLNALLRSMLRGC